MRHEEDVQPSTSRTQYYANVFSLIGLLDSILYLGSPTPDTLLYLIILQIPLILAVGTVESYLRALRSSVRKQRIRTAYLLSSLVVLQALGIWANEPRPGAYESIKHLEPTTEQLVEHLSKNYRVISPDRSLWDDVELAPDHVWLPPVGRVLVRFSKQGQTVAVIRGAM